MIDPHINPYSFEPATGNFFVGRDEIFGKWQERLDPDSEDWKSCKSWIIVGPGGIGKSSFLRQIEWLGINATNGFSKYQPIYVNFEDYFDLSPIDLFEALESRLPKPEHLGTKMRILFDLPPDASIASLGLEVTNKLLQIFSPSYSPASWIGKGIELGGLNISKKDPEGISTRFAIVLNKLIVLSEEQESPVVILLDQLDKAFNYEKWYFLTCQFISLAEKIKRSKVDNIILIFGMRPDRKGELEYKIKTHLGNSFPLNEYTFQTEILSPFSIQEGTGAIMARSSGLIDYSLAQKIVNAVITEGGVDPYKVQLGALSVFAYLYQDDTPKDHSKLTQSEIGTIIKDFYEDLVKIFQKDPIEWEVLKCLSSYSSGLSTLELANRLEKRGINQGETRKAIERILGKSDYWILKRIEIEKQVDRFTISHDLIREYISNLIPDNEKLIENANKTLEYCIWRYQNSFQYLDDNELNLIFSQKVNLTIPQEHINIIFYSLLLQPDYALIEKWSIAYPNEFIIFLKQELQPNVDIETTLRWLMVKSLYLSDKESIIKVINLLINNRNEPNITIRLIDNLYLLGSDSLPSLNNLAYSSMGVSIRIKASEMIWKLGNEKSARQILLDLLQNYADESNKIEIAKTFTRLGETESALQILSNLAYESTNDSNKLIIAKVLNEMNNTSLALSILFDLVNKSINESLRLEAAETIWLLGDSKFALPILLDLAKYSKDESIKLNVANALIRLNNTASALPILDNLVNSSLDEYLKLEVAGILFRSGHKTTALSILFDLAHNGIDQTIKLRAASQLNVVESTNNASIGGIGGGGGMPDFDSESTISDLLGIFFRNSIFEINLFESTQIIGEIINRIQK